MWRRGPKQQCKMYHHHIWVKHVPRQVLWLAIKVLSNLQLFQALWTKKNKRPDQQTDQHVTSHQQFTISKLAKILAKSKSTLRMSTWVARLPKHRYAQQLSLKHHSLKYLKNDKPNSIWNLKDYRLKAAIKTANPTYLWIAKSDSSVSRRKQIPFR